MTAKVLTLMRTAHSAALPLAVGAAFYLWCASDFVVRERSWKAYGEAAPRWPPRLARSA